MSNLSSAAPAIAMIAAFLLIVGSVRLLRQRQSKSRGVLMLLAALVLVMNVMIWTV